MPQINKRVTLNVSGSTYETYEATLRRFPETLLGDPEKRISFYHPIERAHFFNRSRAAFDAILFYYQSHGSLIRPPLLPMEVFEYECLFYELGTDAIKRMKDREGYDSSKKVTHLDLLNESSNKLNWLWKFLEFPESSHFARTYTVISFLLIIVSVFMDCFETESSFLPRKPNHERLDAWGIVKLSLNTFFALEFLLRFVSSPFKCNFVSSLSNVVDFSAIFPSFIIYALKKKHVENVLFVRVLRTFRIFRLVRLSKSFETLSVVLHILSQSLSDLLTLVFCMLISCVVFGGAVYYTELGTTDSQVTSIPEGMWLAMQTVVSIGYGDIVPSSVMGKVAVAVTAVVGALTMTVPVLSLGGRYFSIYTKTFDVSLSSDLINTPGPGVRKVNEK